MAAPTYDADRPAREREEVRRKPAQRAVPRELDHRIANSLQLAVDFLLFQQARLSDPVARAALIDAAERMVAVGHLHRFLSLHDADSRVDLAEFLGELAALIGQSTGLKCDVDVEPVRVPAGMAQQLGLVINELAINAVKHAYPTGSPGDLIIQAAWDDGLLTLKVADNGPGLGGAFNPLGPSGGLGLSIVQAIVRELNARLDAGGDRRGAVFTLVVPLASTGPRPVSRSFAPKR